MGRTESFICQVDEVSDAQCQNQPNVPTEVVQNSTVACMETLVVYQSTAENTAALCGNYVHCYCVSASTVCRVVQLWTDVRFCDCSAENG
jgi:hypothetical protein